MNFCSLCARKGLSSSYLISRSTSYGKAFSTNNLCNQRRLLSSLQSDIFLKPEPFSISMKTRKLSTLSRSEYLTDLGFGFWPPDLVARSLDYLHHELEVPMVFAIFAGAFTVRILLTYGLICQLKFQGVFQEHNVSGREIEHEIQQARFNHRYHDMTKLMAEQQTLTKNFKPTLVKHVLSSGVQLLAFSSMIRCLRHCNELLPEFLTEGPSFSPNLSLADPSGTLPLCLGLFGFSRLILGVFVLNPSNSSIETPREKARKWALCIVPPALGVPFINYMEFSAAISIYLTSTLAVSCVQSVIIHLLAKYEVVKVEKYPPRFAKHERVQMPTFTSSSNKRGIPRLVESVKSNIKAVREGASQQAELQAKKQRVMKPKEVRQMYLEKWREAGEGPPPVTYATNPLLQS